MTTRLAIPLRLGPDGSFATVAQDSPEDVDQCIGAILRHRQGDRWDYPEMGIEPPEFDEDLDVEQIAANVRQHEVRADTDASLSVEDHVAAVITTWAPKETEDA